MHGRAGLPVHTHHFPAAVAAEIAVGIDRIAGGTDRRDHGVGADVRSGPR